MEKELRDAIKTVLAYLHEESVTVWQPLPPHVQQAAKTLDLAVSGLGADVTAGETR